MGKNPVAAPATAAQTLNSEENNVEDKRGTLVTHKEISKQTDNMLKGDRLKRTFQMLLHKFRKKQALCPVLCNLFKLDFACKSNLQHIDL